MSLAIHDGLRSEPGFGDVPSGRDRAVVVAAVIAVLAAIAAPLALAGTDVTSRVVRPVDPERVLTPTAQRVLEQMPYAYSTAGIVVVPASHDPTALWTGAVEPERIIGESQLLGVHGLVPYGYLPASGTTIPALADVSPTDRVYSDLGELSFACTRWPGFSKCSGTLMMEHDGRSYLLRSGLGGPEVTDRTLTVPVLHNGVPADLLLGGAPEGTASVRVRFEGASRDYQSEARMSPTRSIGGLTPWWITVTDPVMAVTFVDRAGRVLASHTAS